MITDYSKIEYMHVERLDNTEVDGLLNGRVFIFPKIDGTNSPIWYDGELCGGARHRILSIEKDNAGFYASIKDDEKLINFFKAHPNWILYSEWLVPHIIKGYRDDAWRKYYVFDVGVICDGVRTEYIPYDIYKSELDKYDIEYLAPLKIITNPTMDDIYFAANNNFYLMKDGQIGEGVVCKNYDYYNKYGNQIWGKFVRAEFRENHYKTMGSPESARIPIEQNIAEEYITKALVEKTIAKIKLDNGEWNSKYIPMLLGIMWHEFINENMFDILKKYKSPTINFKKLNSFVIGEIKKKAPEIF